MVFAENAQGQANKTMAPPDQRKRENRKEAKEI